MAIFDEFRKSNDIESKPETDFFLKVKPWDIGYKINDRYEIIDIKKGGMGIVYISYDHEWNLIVAIKTFQAKYLWNEDVIKRFMAEAETWTELERHSNIVFAPMVQRIEGKPLLFLEYIDHGNLEQFIGNFTIEESLDFAIQFCTGMEYAYQKLGVIHRDIKPANVMVQKDPRFRFGYSFKITDFGLVTVLGDKFFDESAKISTGVGTLPFMPPEQFPERYQEKFSFKGQVTTRSDIFSFGVTLYLLLTGKLPFDDMGEIFTKSPERLKHLNPKIPDSLDILIIKCLEKNIERRYTDFTQLKENLVKIYNGFTGENYAIVGKKEGLTDRDWNNKGAALHELGKLQEAIECFNKALEINTRNFGAWSNKGNVLNELGRLQEAIECFDKALEINPRYADAWSNKANALGELGKYQEAIGCYDKALEINPRFAVVWSNKANALNKIGKPREANGCCDKALEIDPRFAMAWSNKGAALLYLEKPQEAVRCFETFLEFAPSENVFHIEKVKEIINLLNKGIRKQKRGE